MNCKDCLYYSRCVELYEAAGFFFDYEKSCCKQFSERSEWIHLPCKVGDQVFVVYGYEIQHTSVYSIKIESEDDHFVFIIKCMVSQGGARFEKFIFGKTAFLKREEANQALEKRRSKTMSEADFCCDEGAYLASKYFRDQELQSERLNQRIENQREEIRRLQKLLDDITKSRDNWKSKYERVKKQLQQVLNERGKNEKENSIGRS